MAWDPLPYLVEACGGPIQSTRLDDRADLRRIKGVCEAAMVALLGGRISSRNNSHECYRILLIINKIMALMFNILIINKIPKLSPPLNERAFRSGPLVITG